MDTDCESGMCQLSGEATQCKDFCETDRDCGDAGRCLRDGRQTGLRRRADLATERDSLRPAGIEVVARAPVLGGRALGHGEHGVDSNRSMGAAQGAASRAQLGGLAHGASAPVQQRNPREELAKLRSRS